MYNNTYNNISKYIKCIIKYKKVFLNISSNFHPIIKIEFYY